MNKRYRIEIVVDPPRGVVKDEDHDFVELIATADSPKLLEWFLKSIDKNVAVSYAIKEIM